MRQWLAVMFAFVWLVSASVVLAQDVNIADRGELPSIDISNKPQNASSVTLSMHDNAFGYHVTWADGRKEWLSPEAYARVLYRDDVGRTWWKRVLNISTPMGMIWVGLGLLGQVLFAGRMVVQWLVSEREHRSTVPPLFWWMSIIGATMLIAYFAWRKDIIGAGGQATGWLIYVRNLRMIYGSKYARAAQTADDDNRTPTAG